jgi:aspartate racemase
MVEQKTLGILGGMGPLASLEFMRTIYECNLSGVVEQEYPNILLHSLSSVPDRTQALLNNTEELLVDCLVGNLRALNSAGVSKIVICCFTSHSLMNRLPPEIAEKVISLVDLTAGELMARAERSLLLASMGSYRQQVFSSTESALRAKEYIVEPDEGDKTLIQELIYQQLKPGKEVAPVYTAVKGLLEKYQLNSFIAGCSEFHLLSRYIRARGIGDVSFVDPLFSIAQGLPEILEREFVLPVFEITST